MIGGGGDDIIYARVARTPIIGGAGDDMFMDTGGNEHFEGGDGATCGLRGRSGQRVIDPET